MKSWAERRLEIRRQNDDGYQEDYRTRREWLIGEFLMGVVSVATALTGISAGLVSDMLAHTANNLAWFLIFFVSGATFVVIAYVESRCRAHRCGRDVLVRYAYVRFTAHVINFFAWVMAFLWLHFSALNVASIYYEALPLAAANFWAMVEHSKVMWLKPCQAQTTSIVTFGFRLIRDRQ